MTEREYRSVNYNKKRKVSANSSLAVKCSVSWFKRGRKEREWCDFITNELTILGLPGSTPSQFFEKSSFIPSAKMLQCGI